MGSFENNSLHFAHVLAVNKLIMYSKYMVDFLNQSVVLEGEQFFFDFFFFSNTSRLLNILCILLKF